ncbi:flagellar hook-length control protein FliK [Arcobacter sp. FWKO B]|uniref:flagellar hook-length control protein FliK n=1 Tax=Arcobacter sp. FWKO B TaxID=2593672 RepID=UPI0018A58E3D|nr:flagellar hook-length control protein FliK [Arcobacter sp. FWKO B]QOG11315.1 flagellar hook-length control protein FliK [Arcobacter sp. FWKO B]
MILQTNTQTSPQLNSTTQLINILNQKANPILDALMQNNQSLGSQNTSLNTLNPSDFLKNIFQIIKNGDMSQNAIFEMLKNNPTIKNSGTFGENIQELIKMLSQNPTQNSQNVNNLLTHIQNLQPQVLQNSLLNSGIFLESNLLKMALGDLGIQDLTKDIKAVLYQLKNEILAKIAEQPQNQSQQNQNILNQTEKLIAQVEYFQLLSLYGNGNYFYMPFYWEDLVGGTIYTRKDEDKTYCEIDLELQSYGNIRVMLSLFGKDTIDISFSIQNGELKTLLQDNLKLLRANINKADLNLMGVKIIDRQKASSNPYQNNNTQNQDNVGIKI